MARKPKDLGATAEAQILALMKRGGTQESIAAALGESPSTIGRRMRRLRGKTKGGGSPGKQGGKEKILTPTEIPAGASAEVLAELLENARQGLQTAQAEGNLAAMGTMGRLIATVSEVQRKSAPVPVADLNEHPDTKALAAQVAIRMKELCRQVTG